MSAREYCYEMLQKYGRPYALYGRRLACQNIFLIFILAEMKWEVFRMTRSNNLNGSKIAGVNIIKRRDQLCITRR